MTAPADGPTPLPRREPEAPTQTLGSAGLQTAVASSGDVCTGCGSSLAPDQRYCLACGQRRGDPRLPIMDAVVFMDAIKQPQGGAAAPPPPPDKRPFMSANASLVAGVATLVLAIGVGVLIGRSGEGSSNDAANQTPQIIRVGGGGEAETETGTAAGAETSGKSSATKPGSATQKKAKSKLQTQSSGATKATAEVYEPKPGVKLAPPTQKLGGKCDPGVKGCSKSGEFNGSFFE